MKSQLQGQGHPVSRSPRHFKVTGMTATRTDIKRNNEMFFYDTVITYEILSVVKPEKEVHKSIDVTF